VLSLILREKGFSFSPLSMMLAVGSSYMAFIMLRYTPSTYNLPRIFIMKGYWNLLDDFSASIEIIWFFLKVDSMPSVDPNTGLELMTLRSRPELRSRVGCLTNWATQAHWDHMIFTLLSVISYIMFTDLYILYILNHILINPTWLWCMILLMGYWIWFANTWQSIFVFLFIKVIGL